jgi:dimethylaniline monooxygenase (N-oxide forming)
MNYLSPSLMSTNSALGSFFHRTPLGRWLTKAYWNFITSQSTKAAGFGGKAGNVEGLRPDVSDASCFWCDSSIGLVTMDDFWTTLHSADVTIIRDNVESVDAAGVLLRNGSRFRADRVLYCTGWGDHFSFFSPQLKEELGIPPYGAAMDAPNVPGDSGGRGGRPDPWAPHDEAADAVVASRLPLLAAGPKDLRAPKPGRVVTRRRWRLYNRVVPLSLARQGDRSLVMLGQIHTTQTPTIAAVQSLWAVAYMQGEVPLPADDAAVREVAEWNAWVRKRYLGVGERYPYALFDWIPYLDRLLGDLGVQAHRKPGLIADFFEPYGPESYAGVVEEYMAVRKKRLGGKERSVKPVAGHKGYTSVSSSCSADI